MALEVIDTYTLDEFWEYLNPIGVFLKSIKRPILRGQGDANWRLTPNSQRASTVAKYRGNSHYSNQIDMVVLFEYFLLSDFLHFIDEVGYPVPSESVTFRNAMNFDAFTDRFGISANDWPTQEFIPLLALAQHHGIPTRLLDWTRSSFIAAYFAANQVINMPNAEEFKEKGKLAVWIFDEEALNCLDDHIEVVKLPGNYSLNMAAQKGVFVLNRGHTHYTRDFKFNADDLEGLIDKAFQDNKRATLFKMTLPARLAGELLFRCNAFDIHASKLFGGLDGVAKAVLDFRLANKFSGRM
ncbi:FRG domain-containing protein [Methylophilus sp.]|uniref:FRG domain-containing protein n=1 Tax=Methylophilus sp. TaxID=29541 RepID=UPI00403602C1